MNKRFFYILLLIFNVTLFPAAFSNDTTTNYLLRVYEDNDCLNLTSKTTDDAYTNGTRLDFYYTKDHNSKFFLDRWMPKAGKDNTNVYGFSLMQVMNTPKNISSTIFQQNDYPYSGALYATHSLRSYNAIKKYDFQTEVQVGVMGPDAMTKQVQTMVHKIIDAPHPMGWGNEFKNDVVFNVNFSAEKQLIGYRNAIEVIGGGQVLAGTMTDAATCYTLIRIGKMSSYFNGDIRQFMPDNNKGSFKSKIHAYGFVKPGVEYVVRNSLLQGGMFSSIPVVKTSDIDQTSKEQYPSINNIVCYVSYGITVSYGRFGCSYSESTSQATMSNLYSHTVGNISVVYTL